MNYYTSKYIVKPLLFAAAVSAIGISTTMNARFGYSLGDNPIDSSLLAGFSISLDVFKAFALGVAIFLLSSRKRSSRTIGTAALLIWLAGVVWSLASSFGFYTGTSIRAEQAGQVIAEKRTRAHRKLNNIGQDIATIRANKRWTWTQGCTHILLPQSRRMCDRYKTLKQKRAQAEQTLDVLALPATQAQVKSFMDMTGASPEKIKSILGLMFSTFSELFSALGMAIVMAPFGKRKAEKKPAPRRRIRRKQAVVMPDMVLA